MIGNIFILLMAALTAIYLLICIFAYYVSDSIIFPAPKTSYADGPDILKIKSLDGEILSAYFLEAAGSEEVLLYSHGNGEDIGLIKPLLSQYQKRGVSVFAYDYPGYGTSTGRPSEKGVFAAAEAAFRYLTEELGYAPESVTLYGRSLGSGPACWLAARYPVSGLILNGAFSSTFRVMTRVKILPFDKFDNLTVLSKLDCPVLLIHGKRDLVVPFSHALTNEAALKAAAETLWIETATHNNLIELAGDKYWAPVVDFIRKEHSP